MLACVGWTLTHSSGWFVDAIELGLALVPGLGVELVAGLAAMRASREAAEPVVNADEAGDADAELDRAGEAEPDGEADSEAELDVGADADGEGFLARKVGLLVGLPAEADVVGVALADVVGSGDGVMVRVGLGLGVGVGVGVLVAGSTSQTGLVAAEAVAPTAFRDPACAVPDQAASALRITEPPARKLSVVALRCVKRTSTNLSTLLSWLLLICKWFGADRATDGHQYSFPQSGLLMRERVRRSWQAALAD